MNILIHGCGYIGEVHLKSLINYDLATPVLCEANEARLEELAEKYGITHTFTSLDEALKFPLDGAVICTPNHCHKADLQKCVDAGLSVMLEKPMSESLESSKKMVEICESKGKFAFVAYCLRFAPPYKVIKEMICSGKLGKVFGIRASVAGRKAITDAKTNYRTSKAMGGGVISDFSHEIDYALWFADAKVKEVKCVGLNVVHKDWDVQDCADLLINCEGDITISIHMDFLQSYFGRSIEVYGTNGSIRYRDNEDIKWYDETTQEWTDIDVTVDWDEVYKDEMEHYIHCLKSDEKPIIDQRDGCDTFNVIDMCTRNAEA